MNLIEELYINKVKQDELEMVLLTYFSRGEGPNDNKSVYRKDDNENCSLIITYDKKGDICKLEKGIDLTDEQVGEIKARILNELINNQDIQIGREICFIIGCKTDGYFSYKDMFQILPMPPDATQIENQVWGRHPILLEYKYTSSKNVQVNGFRKSKKSRELIPLLHLLSQKRFYGPPTNGLHDWVVEGDDIENITCKFRQIGYWYGKALGDNNSFSSTLGISELKFGKSENNELALIENTDELLDIIFSLDTTKYSKFLTACYWFYTSSEVWTVSHSASYVFLVTCIECLMNEVEKCKCGSAIKSKSLDACGLCGEPQYRIGKNFKEFLEKYSNERYVKLSKEEVSYIYNFRSNMIHGEKIFSRDSEPMGFLGFQKTSESAFHRAILDLIFNALINWIISNK